MSLTVITHTRYDRPQLLERCIESVARGLPANATHRVIACRDNWAKARVDAARSDQYVAFVDDDDTIDPTALQICLDALEATGAGIAFTDEATVDIDGNILSVHTGVREYSQQTVSPRAIHHLCVIRGDAVDPRAIRLHNKHGMGADWFIKTSAAFQRGAVHIPMTGYFWTTGHANMTSSARRLYKTEREKMSESICATWGRKTGRIDMYDPATKQLTTFGAHKYTTTS